MWHTSTEWRVDEIKAVIRYQRLAPLLTPHQVGTLINRIRGHATVLQRLPTVDLPPDPQGHLILAAAIAGEARGVR